jgi:hypothetical protein
MKKLVEELQKKIDERAKIKENELEKLYRERLNIRLE